MATVTEKDIISHLKEKIKFHQQEVKKIENLLEAFTGNVSKEEPSKSPSRAVNTKTSTASAKKRPTVQKSERKPAAKAAKTTSKPASPKKEVAVAKAVVAESRQKTGEVADQAKAASPADKSVAPKTPAKKSSKAKSAPAAKKSSAVENKGPKLLAIPAEYDDKMTINAKIAFALNEIGEGYNEDIANAMALYEPRSDAKRLGKQISGVLSTLKNKGYLTARREGRKDKFALVK